MHISRRLAAIAGAVIVVILVLGVTIESGVIRRWLAPPSGRPVGVPGASPAASPSEKAGPAFRSLPPTTFGLKPFLLAFGHYSDQELDFMAQNYAIIVVGPGFETHDSTLARLRKDNPKLVILDYAGFDGIRPYFPDWKLVNTHEEMFAHSANPASPVVSRIGGAVNVSWSKDGRTTFNIAGYNIYRGTAMDSTNQKLNTALITGLSYSDTTAPPGRTSWYSIKTVDTDGNEYGYSQPFSVDTLPAPLPIAFSAQSYSGGADKGSLTFSATCSGPGVGVWLYVDSNRNHSFSEPGEKIAMTAGPGGVFTATTPAPKLGGLPYYFECTDGVNVLRLPSDGSYVTNTNNRLHNPAPGSNYDITNVIDPAWQQHETESIVSEVDRMGYDGLFVDTVNVDIPWWESDASPQGEPYYSPQLWRSNTAKLLQSVKAALHGQPIYYNGATSPPDFLQATDGVLTENWAHANWLDRYPTEAEWRQQVDEFLAVPKGKLSFLVSGGKPEDTQARMYSYASYLIVNKGTSLYSYMPDYLTMTYYPEYTLDVGTPVQNADSAAGYLNGSSRLYSREYTNAIAFVNPGSNSALSISLPHAFYLAQPSGGDTAHGGVLTFLKTSSLTLAPNSGAVLLKNPPPAAG